MIVKKAYFKKKCYSRSAA